MSTSPGSHCGRNVVTTTDGEPRSTRPLTILLVDDDAFCMAMSKRTLRRAGMRVHDANSAFAARELLMGDEAPEIDAIVCDGLDGLWMNVRAIRQDIPFLLLSGEIAHVRRARALGLAGVLREGLAWKDQVVTGLRQLPGEWPPADLAEPLERGAGGGHAAV